VAPRDIYITGFDSAPLAPDFEQSLVGKLDELNAAVKLLQLLTDGKIYIGVRNGSCLEQVKGAEIIVVNGPHPAGNVGIQIANTNPVNKGDVVWTMNALTLLRIGHLASTGELDMNITVALTGCEVTKPQYINTVVGADIKSLIAGQIKTDNVHHRIISGNVLTGAPVTEDDYLRFPYTQITVIPEGDDHVEFMGWASLSPKKMSVSRSFPGHFLKRAFCPDARLQGGRRAMIMSCVYDEVLPMDILPEYLIKAILSRNLERMEALGIYEVAPEDFALCEYVDPSKLELQKIVQEGIDYIQKELN
jgi:Na+-transporting NADH:ubiquinone oxidoreductase subunit A